MKYRWPMGPLGLALLTLLCCAAGAAQAGTWTNLWSTREQQAQKLLDSSNPAAAAPLFTDARRRGYAEMEAGQYAQAARSLEPFKDADSQYNRGNALAHSGRLREALSAYDAALTAAPGDKDVIRNRDLVRRALERQQQNQSGKQGGGNGRPGSQGSKGGQSQGGSQSQGGGQPQSGNQSPSGNQSRAGSQSQPGNESEAANQRQNGGQSPSGSQPGGAQTQAGPGGNQTQRGDPSQPDKPSQAANQQGGKQPPPGGQAPQSQTANRGSAEPPAQAAQTPSGAARPGDNPSGEGALASNGQQTNGSTAAAGLNAENAQQDADAALRYRQSQQGRAASGTSPNDTGRATLMAPDGTTRSSADVPPPKPPSEQTLALDQWLRGIPDDSGELLRRKFLIEHRLRQQANEQ
jgi:Ca-activated chloride channel homolog